MLDLKPAGATVIELLNATTDEQLDRPTPCSEYTVAQLIEHIREVAVGFAAMARKDSDRPDDPDSIPSVFDAARRRETAELVDALTLAWDAPEAWDGTTALSPDVVLPNEVWGRIVLTELVVHGWDLARATGRPLDLPTATLRACLDHVVDFVPKAPVPQLWGPAVDASDDAALIDRIVAVTGRDPRWPGTASES
ncbi:TIGR03086 family metal-binding protein [Nocardia brasiliensis]|uniref:TIGR03086 family metal-binding protein n=1 Tax=Nocardia brasiliensis TaxID=37326 RepID=UPI003D92BA39